MYWLQPMPFCVDHLGFILSFHSFPDLYLGDEVGKLGKFQHTKNDTLLLLKNAQAVLADINMIVDTLHISIFTSHANTFKLMRDQSEM